MNPPPLTLQTIADALGKSKQAVHKQAKQEGWAFAENPVRGGKQRVYAPDSLPQAVRDRVGHWLSRPLPGPLPVGEGGNAVDRG